MNIYDRIGKFGLYSLLEGTDRLGNADTWFVDGNSGNAANTAGAGQGASWDLPFSTLNYAISRCSNDASNVILVAADHTENWTTKETASGTTTTGACVNKSGVTIIGFGTQDRRPTFLTTAAAGTLNIVATECSLYNLVFKSNYADTATLIITDSAGDGLLVENCEFRDSAANKEHKLAISIAANCDDTTIRGCRFLVTDGATASEAAIRFVGAHYRSTVQDCFFRGDWGGDSSDGVIDASTTASYDMLIDGNIINNMDATYGAGIEVHASTTGVVSNNIVYCVGTAGAPIEATGCVKANNKTTVSVEYEAQEGGVSSIGKTFYVDSGTGVIGNLGTSWADALPTIETAIQVCTTNNGDTILVAAGHSEVLTGATVYICDIDLNGLTIRGLGNGSNRPLIECNTLTHGVVEITSDNVTIENIVFAGDDTDNVEYMIRVDGLNCTLKNCEFIEGVEQTLTCITVGIGDGLANGLTIDSCKFLAPTDDSMTSAVSIIKDMANVTIKNCLFQGSFDEACIELVAEANACTNLHILDNIMINTLTGQHCIQISGVAVTGLIAGNTFVNDTRDQAVQPSLCQMANNKWSKIGTGMVGIDNVDPNVAGFHFFVNSTTTGAADTAGHGYSWAEPLATIEAAIQLCTASAGDIIHVGPGHEETISDSVFLDFDIAGITCIGYGVGTARPKITFDNVAAVVDIGAADIRIENFVFRASVSAVAVGVDVLNTFNHAEIVNCDFGYPEEATDEFAIAIQIGAVSDDCLIENCKFQAEAQASVIAIKCNGANDHLVIRGCTFSGAYSTCVIQGATNPTTYSNIYNNLFMCTGTTDTFNLVAASTGMVHDNRIVLNAAAYNLALDIGNCWNVNNYAIADDDVGGAKGGLIDNGFTSCVVTADG